MLDIDLIEDRNNDKLNILLKQYKITKTIADLVDTVSVYIATDKKKEKDNPFETINRIRLMCTDKIYDLIDNGEYTAKVFLKTKKVQLYTINNKAIQELSKTNELNFIVSDLNYICNLIKELQYIQSIKQIEDFLSTNR